MHQPEAHHYSQASSPKQSIIALHFLTSSQLCIHQAKYNTLLFHSPSTCQIITQNCSQLKAWDNKSFTMLYSSYPSTMVAIENNLFFYLIMMDKGNNPSICNPNVCVASVSSFSPFGKHSENIYILKIQRPCICSNCFTMLCFHSFCTLDTYVISKLLHLVNKANEQLRPLKQIPH